METIWDAAENVLLPLERKLFVTWEKIFEALKMVCSAYASAK
jgi:hypothetical protein